MGHERAVHRHSAADFRGLDAAKDGAHDGQRLLAVDFRLPVVLQGVHKLVDNAGAGAGLKAVSGGCIAHIPHHNGGTGIAVDEHDALSAV